MKITKAQKDAVISLLKEKFEDKNKVTKDAYLKEHAVELEIKVNHVLALQEEAEHLAKRLQEIYLETRAPEKLKDGDFALYGVHPLYDFYRNGPSRKLIESYSKDRILQSVFVKKIEEPNYEIVARELELASLGKDFDLDGFLAKYLPR